MAPYKSGLIKALLLRIIRFAAAALQGLLKVCVWAVPLISMMPPLDQEGFYDPLDLTGCSPTGRHATPERNIADPLGPPEQQPAVNHHNPRAAGYGCAEPPARLSPAERREWAALIRQFD
jgi:hypothetical protein